ncbi:Pre-rRNA-processing protein TSR2-domain-containing protein [Gautieria morchelliformis]|nr:Pre-rRNA-processing protein TSR2-domain-containing protein [Gautieria morchelliformis]
MATSASTPPAASPALVLFARGTVATLSLWPALRLAVEGSWGGPESPQKRTWLASAIVDAFEESSSNNDPVPDAIYIEEMLLQVLTDEFDVVLEDGTAQPVAAGIVKLWQEIMHEGKTDGVARLEACLEQSRGKKLIVDEKDASDEECQWEDEDEESDSEEAPQLSDRARDSEVPQVDEDGFTVVTRRGKGHR